MVALLPLRVTLLQIILLIPIIKSTFAFHPSLTTHPTTSYASASTAFILRGGSDEEYDESEYDEYDDEEDEEPIVLKAKALAASTKSKMVKNKKVEIKSKLTSAMSTSSPKNSGGVGKLYRRFVPHILRACLNPFTFFRMSRAYFASLIDIHYLKEEPTQNLRSALAEKARQQPPSSFDNKPKRKMKPGQAKTLSDLPQLSA